MSKRGRTWMRVKHQEMWNRFKTDRPEDSVRNSWYRIKNLSSQETEILIYDEIGWFGITAKDFVDELDGVFASKITLRLNTPGGEVFDGLAIYNALLNHDAEVDVYVDGLAASIGSVIAQAGDKIVMAKTAQMMIHDAFGLTIGNAKDMRETADLLDKTSDNIASVYAERSGKPLGQWREAMQAETWYSSAESVTAGLADEVAPGRTKTDDQQNSAKPKLVAEKEEKKEEDLWADFDPSAFLEMLQDN